MAALKRANVAREEAKSMRELLKKGEVDPIALLRGDLEHFESVIAKWKVEKLLMMVPRMGRTRTFVVLAHLPGQPTEKVGKLTWERRAKLASLVHDARMLRL